MQCIFSILGQQGCLRTVFYQSAMRAKFCKVIVKMWRWWDRYNMHRPQISLLPGSQTRAQTKSSDRRHLCSKHTMWNMCKALIARKNWPPFCKFLHRHNNWQWWCWRWFLAHWNIALESCKTQSAPNERYNFPKMRVGVKGRLEFFRKFIRVGTLTCL